MNITRRAALGGIASIGATGGATTALALAVPEHPLERLHRIVEEIPDLMKVWNHEMGGAWELQARASDAGGCGPIIYKNLHQSPALLIEEHIGAIYRQMKREHPGWEIQTRNELIHPEYIGRPGTRSKLPASRHCVMVYAYEDQCGPERARWFVDYEDLRRGA